MILSLLILGLWIGSLYALMAVALTLVRPSCGFIDFALAGIATSGAYIAYAGMHWSSADTPLLSGILWMFIGVAVASAVGVSIYWLIYQRLLNRRANPLVLMITSLGVLVVIGNVIAIAAGDRMTVLPFRRPPGIEFLGTRLSVTQCVALSVALGSVTLLWALSASAVGKRIRALQSDEDLARICGIDVAMHRFGVYAVASGCAGLCGVLWACDNDLHPELGFRPLLFGLAGAVVAGFRNPAVAAAGATIAGVLGYIAVWQFSGEWQDAVAFAILAVFILFRSVKGQLGRDHSG